MPIAAPEKSGPFLRIFAASTVAMALLVGLAVLLLDPYGVSPIQLPIRRPIMDINQRYMYPQVVRSHAFDSAVFGTSTVRLLEPERLNRAFGGSFANLGMNAATPWEQMQLASLFLRETPVPGTIILGFDSTWCEPDADAKKKTFRPFPETFYDDNPLNDWPSLFNWKTVEITVRLAAFHLGRVKARIRADGYEVFVPDEVLYNLAQVQQHIWGAGTQAVVPVDPAVTLSPAQRDALIFPALAWLNDWAGRIPAQMRLIVLIPPVHVAAQPAPGSRAAAVEDVCRERLVAAVRPARAAIVDMRLANPLTSTDSNYWDPLHYRVGVAGQLVDLLLEASRPHGRDGPLYRRLDP